MQLEELLERSAVRWPEKTALICEGRRFSYSRIERLSNRLAHLLVDLGVKRGDRVAVYLDNSVETVLSIFAILKAGAVFLVINPTTKSDKVAYILNDCRASCLISHLQKRRFLEPALDVAPHLASCVLAGGNVPEDWPAAKSAASLERALSAEGGPESPPPRRCIDIDLAALVYTSGSTGNPKGVMLTHLNMVSAATSITTYLENTPDDIILNVLPLSFDYGLYQVLMGFKVGATVVLERSFAYPGTVLNLIEEERITGFPILPTILAILFQMDLSRYDFSSLRYVTNTGAALPTSHILKLRELFPAVKVYSMYGLTECKRVSYLPPDQIDRRPTSVGRGMPNEEVYVVDEGGRRVGPGVVGELVVRGSNVMKGYWGLPEESEKVLRPGPLPGEKVLYTGDLFRTDEEGYLYFLGRKDDIIKSRGEKVSPKEVENVLHQMDGVAEAAVVGIPDPVLGSAITAFIRPANGVTLTDQGVLRHCSDRLENFMVPKLVVFRPEFPRTSSGKVDKRALAGSLSTST
ncbi:MAG: AMP-binding protein [Planctomycetes bacterium]|nr:AMP-binding protein [Planctomycetota bacterium]